jgi:chromosome segregation ATPase
MSKVKEYYLEEEYNPIEAIDKLQQENAKLRIQISAREKEYIKLQQENEYFNHCDEEKRKTITNLRYKIERLEEENAKLKELCDKYEEEHNTKFNEWVFDKRENERLKQIIKTANMMEYFKAYDILQGVDKE